MFSGSKKDCLDIGQTFMFYDVKFRNAAWYVFGNSKITSCSTEFVYFVEFDDMPCHESEGGRTFHASKWN